jgi:Dyp-type peroxidase family
MAKTKTKTRKQPTPRPKAKPATKTPARTSAKAKPTPTKEAAPPVAAPHAGEAAFLDLDLHAEIDPAILESFARHVPEHLRGIEIPVATPLVPHDVPGSPAEPIYDARAQADIQGNIIPGFNKPHQHFLFFEIDDPKRAKAFLKWLVPYLSSMEEVMHFRRLYRSKRLAVGRDRIGLCATWANIAFSHRGTAKLVSKDEANAFGDAGFRIGMAQRSTYLGDPGDPDARGHRSRWKVGNERKGADIVVILAADNPGPLGDFVDLVKLRAVDGDLRLLFEQRGADLPAPLRGHEHFGFKDGVSQPGVRGKLSSAPGDYITPRYIADTDERRLYFAKPGQLLTWPGQYLLGEPRQDTEQLYTQAPSTQSNFPKWAARGSYLVVRRLFQDVPAFWKFAEAGGARMGMSPTQFASTLVGRWPSGAPIMRTPTVENAALAGDELANNHFLFDDDTRPSSLRPIPGYGGDGFPRATADFLARVCPHFAHIRKVNPRDGATDLGKPLDSLARMILRRGIPYGAPIVGVKRPSKKLYVEDRGLMFLCYAATIEDQFELMQRRWANSPVQPSTGGHDPIIGQNGSDASRVRYVEFPRPGGGVAKLRIKGEWVIPTGGGYFFAPTIGAVRDVYAA